jgi:cobalt-zinc-cadmium efflux system outer membrane protein
LWFAVVCAGAQAQIWNLEASVERAVAVAPDMRGAEAVIAGRAGELRQSGAWPNPTVELRVDEKLGIEDGSGGYSLNQVSVSQAIPLGRLTHQRRAAAANLDAAREGLLSERLQIETRAAHAFHALQLTVARQRLAQERLAFAEGLRTGTGPLVRYLSPLERARLDVLRETARQDVAHAEGKWSEAQAQFRALLGLPPDAQPEITMLVPADAPAALSALHARLAEHPALRATQQALESSRANVDVARAGRLADPTVSIFREQDYFSGGRQDYLGVMLSVQIPLWHRNAGDVARARAEVDKVEALLDAQRRTLESRMRQSYLHLGHLIEQAGHYRTRLLEPAQQVLRLTRKAFAAGEQNGLALMDASNTYFDTQARYLELLQEAWIEAADLRLATGMPLTQGKGNQP